MARLWRGRGEGSSDQAQRSPRTEARPSLPGRAILCIAKTNIEVLITLSTLHHMCRTTTDSSPPITLSDHHSWCVSCAVGQFKTGPYEYRRGREPGLPKTQLTRLKHT
ncbi:uncharacterized protein F4817DRAFT_347409 [Daldinia loculata]|uniref:uncharacterized protein n=1 Tax=Daldinia loculata TaxID=103429 RepID=UPI0020C57D3F|nr:uncharacterized protein F4817DRAFT_347409 [Daldinia loculata]KAI1644154.1 hypothetical protein F4817DRAFT_347409 [Daldinia loculata]